MITIGSGSISVSVLISSAITSDSKSSVEQETKVEEIANAKTENKIAFFIIKK